MTRAVGTPSGAGESASPKGRNKTGGGGTAGLRIERVWTTEGVHPYDEVTWERRDVIIVVNLAEQPKRDYAIGLPFAGDWFELLNSDVYDNFPNPAPVGNGGHVRAWSEPLDGFAASAAVTLPANGVIVLARSSAR